MNKDYNKKMSLISEVATRLYSAESISRKVIQEGDTAAFQKYHQAIDTISTLLDSLRVSYDDKHTLTELGNIYNVLTLKEENLHDLLELRRKKEEGNYYDRVLKKIKKSSHNTAPKNYKTLFQNLEPYQQKVLIDYLKYVEKDKINRLSGSSIDSLINQMGQVLQFMKQYEKRDTSKKSSGDYRAMVSELKPYQQKVLNEYLEYAGRGTPQSMENVDAKSLMTQMKQVLRSFAEEEHNYQEDIAQKEQKLLMNDRKISRRLIKIRTEIEQETIQKSLARVKASQKVLNQTSKIMIVFGIACVLTILIFVVLIIRDTNKSRRYRKALEEAKSYAEGLLKSREQIMATVVHDLRSPLNSISGFSDLIEKTALSDKQKKYLHQLKASSGFTMRLVNDLLDFSRLESGKILIEALPFIPKNVIESAVRDSIPAQDPKNLDIKLDLKDQLADTYISDPFRLKQILANLVGNAYKFTEHGEINVSGEIVTIEHAPHLKVAVQDTGIGIDKHQQEQIFHEFSQADSNQEKSHKGFGLGLAICQELTSLLHGNLEVESEKGKGSTFTLTIPIKPSEKQLNKLQETKNIRLCNTQGRHILVVDDDDTHLDLTTEVLHNQGFEIATAKDGKQALEMVKQYDFDLVLTDIQMPRLDGYELVQQIRKEEGKQELPVIAISGEGAQSRLNYLERGFTEYLLKPYKSNELLLLIAEILKLKTVVSQKTDKTTKVPENKYYDLSELKQFTAGDQESLHAILESLLEDTVQNIKKLKAAQQVFDIDKIAFIAHKMLPMLRQIKAQKIIEPLATLEQLKTADKSKDEINQLIEQVLEHADALIEKLRHE